MARPRIKYNPRSQQWELRGKGGAIKATFQDDGDNQLLGNLEVGLTSDKMSKLYGFVATLSAAVAVASGALGVGTLQSSTGSGVGCSELAVGDMVFGVPKVSLATVGLAGFRVPTTSTLNVYLHTIGEDAGGSLAACGFDMVAFRF